MNPAMVLIFIRSQGERTCCALPDCPVWGDEYL